MKTSSALSRSMGVQWVLLVLLLTGVATGCSRKFPHQELLDVSPPSATAAYDLYVGIYGTSPRNRKNRYVQGIDPRVRVPVQWMFWYAEGNGRKIVIDPGFEDAERVRHFLIDDYHRPDRVLADLGVRPEEVTDVFLTSLDRHRAGSIHRYPNARVHVPAGAYANAKRWTAKGQADEKQLDEGSVRYLEGLERDRRLVQMHGSFEVFEGFKAYMESVPTPFFTYYSVSTPSGPYVIASDLAPLVENLRSNLPVPGATRRAITRTYRRLRQSAGSSGRILTGFDPAVSKQHQRFSPNILTVAAGTARVPVDRPLSERLLLNAHEHIASSAAAERYVAAARQLGIRQTFVLGSYEGTFDRTDDGGSGSDRPRPYHASGVTNTAVLEMGKRYPGELLPFVLVTPGMPDKIGMIREAVRNGAAGVHVTLVDVAGLRSDERSMWPVYEYCQKEGLPVFIHLRRTAQSTLTNILENFPALRVHCPHLLYYPDDLDYVRSMLKDHPNLSTDLTFGFSDWLKPNMKLMSRNADRLAALIREFPDRFLWGTDTVVPDREGPEQRLFRSKAEAYRRLLEERIFLFELMDPKDRVLRGMALEEELLKKIYSDNAVRFLKGPSAASGAVGSSRRTTVLLTGSSLAGEGLANDFSRHRSGVKVSNELLAVLREADLFHMSNETSLCPNGARGAGMRYCSSAEDLKRLGELGVDIIELTGNHLMDFGSAPFLNTLSLYRSGLQATFGGGADGRQASAPLRIVKNGQWFTFIGFNMISGTASDRAPGGNRYIESEMVRQIGEAKQNGDIVSVHFQWGDEFNLQPMHWQRRIAYRAVDAGADIVVGTHSHAFTGHETYKGKPVFYGLGNFLFDHTADEATRTGAMLRLSCVDGKIESVDIIPVVHSDGELDLPDAAGSRAIVERWQKYPDHLSSPAHTVEPLDLFILGADSWNGPELLQKLARACGLGPASALIRDWDRRSGVQREPVRSFAVSVSPSAAGWDPAQLVQERALGAVFFERGWSSESMESILRHWPNDGPPAWVPLAAFSDRPDLCVVFLEKYPAAGIYLDFGSDDRLMGITDAFSNRAEDWSRLLKKYAERFRIGFSVRTDRVFRSEAHRIRFFTRRLFAIRNALEAEHYRFPVLSDAGLEWGYPQQEERVKTGLALDLSTVRSIYGSGSGGSI